ncbi:Tc5 transposase DNA-binding domain [Popillia japonica]|uniref:Tc5 transposase DNA-binding domain n=1 Tax=Popillia japonica TaxID=7064 RepID=A0AAW1JZY0_POPJA
MRPKNISISELLIKEQAIKFSEKPGHIGFVASTAWLDKFENRHGIIQKVISGESADDSDMECVQWTSTVLKAVKKRFQPKDIFYGGRNWTFL